MKCEICREEIDPERLEALPNTTRCAKHSNAVKQTCFMDFSHKTAPALVVIDTNNREELRLATRAYRRSR